MSKSLKNFVTIDDALLKYSARQLRFAFLLQTWNAKLDFKDSSMQEVRSAESLLNVGSALKKTARSPQPFADTMVNLAQNFFAIVNALDAEIKADSVASDGQHHYNEPERAVAEK